ncbi:MAG: chemotaxis protein [Betaproteobacteria bacterium RIFCSPLOWO2_12_FULL_63_13]|nr:MAG: chemotaxis protein [Betaproteobacteria bacterium RIFCSPLOWO2_02_FULL_63_19]OGA51221.1 MAG: chemotaxis protein [Betaproteobacteria bacterium RIFCSPLOWO2_12_FULL_63_13]
MAFSLPSNRGGKAAIADKKNAASTSASSNATAARRASRALGRKPFSPLPVIGKLPVAKQLQVLLVGFGILLVIAGVVIFVDYRTATNSTAYVATAGEMRMLSQRLSNATQAALTGSAGGFRQLTQSRAQFKQALDLLMQGGMVSETALPPTSDAVMPTLEALGREWEKIDRNVAQVLGQQKNLIGLGTAVRTVNSNNEELLKLTEAVLALKLQANAQAREISQIGQMVMLTQRMAKNANALLGSDAIDAQVAQLMDRDVKLFGELISALQKGSDSLKISATRDPETAEKLAQLQKTFAQTRPAFVGIVSGLPGLARAKLAATRVVADSDALFDATEKLTRAYRGELGTQVYFWVLVVDVLLGIGLVWLMVKAYVDDQRRLAQDAEHQREDAERQNRANQEAILRLMDEMQAVAGGDLTVKATVSEDMTGVIADSVNFTIEELRVLVGRINSAATEVAAATAQAERTSTQLLAAADYQSRQIQETSSSVLKMAEAMNRVMASTSQSANVARQSLGAAQKGTQAVQNSIAGMNEIRDQIQDTSKRIKRLGESSQQIGEIVELISDITEQTNVLALNAAIQAASAGEAGRGFTVVAEEVQRLAERSGEATKQIGAIVKTIQTDTLDAVSAMEKSTRGVVDGARLSDAAGQALAEIGEVSQRLSGVIESIAEAIQNQTNSATKVAGNMQDILRITQQTTDGTKRTATSVEQLAALAKELKGSVSRFRME